MKFIDIKRSLEPSPFVHHHCKVPNLNHELKPTLISMLKLNLNLQAAFGRAVRKVSTNPKMSLLQWFKTQTGPHKDGCPLADTHRALSDSSHFAMWA